MQSQIAGTGSYLPEYTVTNEMFSKWLDTSDEWITSRTGIRQRRISGMGTAELAARAASRALKDAGVEPRELDWILVATCTPDYCFPSVACKVQEALGAKRAVCMDVEAACSGFLFALRTADAYICSGMARCVLVIGAERMSRLLDWNDRSTCVLFGDGAGAAVVTAREKGGGILSAVLGADGGEGEALTCRSAGTRPPFETGAQAEEGPEHLVMDGRQIFQFALRRVPQTIRETLAAAKLTPDQISVYLLHQANQRILAAIGHSLEVSPERIPVNLNRCGNMAAASIPVLLDEVNRAGKLTRGERIVLAGFGAGLTWGAMALVW